jgi:glycosyltransferase involved in cell wall biosynthesis
LSLASVSVYNQTPTHPGKRITFLVKKDQPADQTPSSRPVAAPKGESPDTNIQSDESWSGNNSRREADNVLFIGKRFYTNRDTLLEEYGRIYQLPHAWASQDIPTELWLVDYHGKETLTRNDDSMAVSSTPIKGYAFIKKLGKLMLGTSQYTHVVASGDCYIGLLGYLIAKRLSATFVFDVYDKYDDFVGYRSPPGVDLFRFLLNRAHYRLFASIALLKQLEGDQKRSYLVPNGIDYTQFREMDIAICRQELQLTPDTPLIGYFGGMEPDRGIEDLIEAVRLLRSEGTPITLLLGGKSNGRIDFNVAGVEYLGDIPFQQMPSMLGACDLLAVPYRRSGVMDAGASNKIVEALACARPIVATRTPNLIANFQTTAKSLESRLAEPGDPHSIAKVIKDQLRDPILGVLPKGWSWPEIALNTAHQLELQGG